MEITVVLLKPDCIEKNLVGEIIQKFEGLGLRIQGCKMLAASHTLLKEHYSHLANKPFFPDIVNFMQSTPIIALALKGHDCVESVRNLLGPTDPEVAPQGSIRGDYGTDKMKNIAHASDSPESANAELKRFFKDSEIF